MIIYVETWAVTLMIMYVETWAVTLMIMYVETFKTDIVFISNVVISLTSHWPNLKYQSPFVDANNITLWDQMKNIEITDNYIYSNTYFLLHLKTS
jgi:hypothetical protein